MSAIGVSLAGLATLASAVSITVAPSATSAVNDYDCGNFFGVPTCIHWWGSNMNDASDYAQVNYHEGETPQYALFSSDRNNDGLTIALQVDTTDGADGSYYTRCDLSPDGQPEIWNENTIRRFRFIAVRTGGGSCEIDGTPTEWHTPPWN